MKDISDDSQIIKISNTGKSDSAALPLGEILVNEKIISVEQLNDALNRQKEELSYPLGKILVDMKFINPSDLKRAIDILGKSERIGDYLVQQSLISKDQLSEALAAQKEDDKLLGKILLDLGYIDRDKLVKALMDQTNKPKLGEWLISKGLLSPVNLKVALRFQARGRRIGEILVELGYLSRDKLDEVIEMYDKRESFESTLLREGFISHRDLEQIKIGTKGAADNLAQVLISKGALSESHVAEAQAIRYEIPYQRFDNVMYSDIDRQTLASILSASFTRKNLIIPAFVDNKSIVLAVTDPSALSHAWSIKDLHKDHEFTICFTTGMDFERIYSRLFGVDSNMDIAFNDAVELVDPNINDRRLRELGSAKQTEASRYVNMVIEKGLAIGATDIHFENDSWGTHIRYRVDGLLRDMDDAVLTSAIAEDILSVISRLKVMSDMDLAERRRPQDGSFRMMYRDRNSSESYPIDFRVSTVKGRGFAENIAIRVLDPKRAEKSLEELHYSTGDLKIIRRLLGNPAGLFLLTGPTGCGKTTTLYACLKHLNNSQVKIMTSEDPVEYVIPGITQVNTNDKIGMTHANILRSFLRQDPDVILFGEIRDEETAEVVTKAAETGHLILSTLHTADPVAAILRLINLGIAPDSLSATLLGIISQRLLNVNCPDCREEYLPKEEEWSPFFIEYPLSRRFYRSRGCANCDYIGLKGRRPVYEFLVVDRNIQKLLWSGLDVMQIRDKALINGMVNMVEHAMAHEVEFNLHEMHKMIPHNIIEEFKTNPIINNRTIN